MDGVLSNEEISALLDNDTGNMQRQDFQELTDTEKDAIGEVGNISMGTAATTLSSLVNRKVEISTPVVTLANWEDIVAAYERPCVFIRIAYTTGLDGSNLLVSDKGYEGVVIQIFKNMNQIMAGQMNLFHKIGNM